MEFAVTMFFALMASLVIISDDLPASPTAKELKQLQGKWRMVQGEKNGEKTKLDENNDMILEIMGDRWIFTGEEKGKIIRIDKRRIDIASVEDGDAGNVSRGIYKLDGRFLSLCIYQGKAWKRPTEFTSKEEDIISIKFKRVDP
jgi:uncharacterized protein (TIGR03067 family)